MANCPDLHEGKQCWGTAEEPHRNHWADELEWPNEEYVAPRPRVADSRGKMRDIANRINEARRRVDRQVVAVGAGHPETSHAAAARALPHSGTLRQTLLDLIRDSADGLTDFDLERMLGRTHQSVSGCRNTLMNDGWIEDSGRRRRNERGNPSIVWVYVP
jgi:hypothetical protein